MRSCLPDRGVCSPQWPVLTDCSSAPPPAQAITLCPFFPSASACVCVHLLFITNHSCASVCVLLGPDVQRIWAPSSRPFLSPSRLCPSVTEQPSLLMCVVSITCFWTWEVEAWVGSLSANGWVLIQYYCLVTVYGIVLWHNDYIMLLLLLFYMCEFIYFLICTTPIPEKLGHCITECHLQMKFVFTDSTFTVFLSCSSISVPCSNSFTKNKL